MTLVVDASVAMKWFVEEPGSRQAEAVLQRDDLVAPALILAEITNAFWKRVRRHAASRDQALAALDRLPQTLAALAPMEPLRSDAMQLAIAHDHPACDCFYIALARREGAPIATADKTLAELAQKVGVTSEYFG